MGKCFLGRLYSLGRSFKRESTPKNKKNHGDTEGKEVHRVLLISAIDLVKLRGFVPLRQAHRQAKCGTQRNTL